MKTISLNYSKKTQNFITLFSHC